MLWEAVYLLIFLGGLSVQGKYHERPRHHREYVTTSTVSTPLASTPSQEQLFDEIIAKQNPCLVHFCGKGRECHLDEDGRPVCECQKRCPKHYKPVCGTDQRLYNNHCELHRTACLQRRPIAVDHSLVCSHRPTSPVNDTSNGPEFLASSRTSAPDALQEDILHNTIDGRSDDLQTDECTLQQYEIMKVSPLPAILVELQNRTSTVDEVMQEILPMNMDNLLLYNHAKLMAEDNHSSGKDYLLSIMFSHYDQNNDGSLEKDELDEIANAEHLNQLSKECTIGDMLSFDDADKDERLNINEFYMAFSKLYSVSVVSLDKALQVNRLSARVGDNVEIKCDVTGTPPPPIVWRRYDADLAGLALGDDDVRVFSDGALYLTRIQLVHAGNYTCHAQRNKDVVQTHVLTVHTTPEVKVTPRIQSKRPGEDVSMFCHVVGEPFPQVEWLKNDEPLRLERFPRKYRVVGNGTELRLRHIGYADTGAYMCQATSTGGLTRDISSLVVQEDPTPSFPYSWTQMIIIAAPNEERRFFSFHDWGVSVYEPTACRLYHQIQATDIIPGTQQYVCGDKGVNCSWGQAINVANRYVYVAQPHKDRVLVISKIQMVVVDVVVTDKLPVELHYVPHLDQVWVLNWRSERNHGVKTIQVIRNAAQKRKHHTVHPEPIDGQFDLIKGLFMPPVQDLNHKFKYGYVTHSNQRGMYKMDLANMRYVKSIDLSAYSCAPRHLQFSSLYGLVIVECEDPDTGRSSGQLLLDYLTDTVLSHKAGLLGRPYVSPNSRVVVTLDRDRDGVTLVVQNVQDGGLKFSFDVKTTLNISDITFYPSQTTHGYDLYASAADKEDILFLNLATGKVEMITGVGKAMQPTLAQWGTPNRPIAASGVFGHYMVTSANEALFVVNGETRTVNCEIGGMVHPRDVVWVTMHLQ